MLLVFQGTNEMKVEYACSFMGVASMTGQINMQLDAQHGKHNISGKISGFDLRKVNPIIEPTTKLRVNKGNMKGLKFWLDASYYQAKGSCEFLYNDLNLKMLSDKKEIRSEKRAVNFLVSQIIKKQNPLRNQAIRVGQINYPNDKYNTIFSFWFNSVMQGVVNSLGPPDMHQKLEKTKKIKASLKEALKGRLLNRLK